MYVRFWGVRGSTPTPIKTNLRYGGNTPCIEVRLKNDDLFVLDCGTGFRQLERRWPKSTAPSPFAPASS